MFTGLIEEIGRARRVEVSSGGAGLTVEAGKVLSGLEVGDSIAVSGPCLTVTAVDRDSFTAWAMPETLEKTTLGRLAAGRPVNLERAAALGDRLGGHLVSGHIDARVKLTGRRRQGEALVLTVEPPPELLRYIIEKGSVALDGVSLTVIAVDESCFSVGLIPHTAATTTLGRAEVGSDLNLEVDMIGKYVEKMLTPHLEGARKAGSGRKAVSVTYLQEKGFL